jgi:Flp pilus assembly pilin Flp
MFKWFNSVRKRVHGVGRDDRGVSAVEYALLIFLVSIVIIFTVSLVGGHLKTIFGNAATSLSHGSTSTSATPTPTPTPTDTCHGGGGDAPCHGGG